MRRNNKPIKDILLDNIEVIPESGCWIWMGSADKFGHGRAYINRKVRGVHRLSYAEFVEPIPEGICVLHRCDVPPCINPDHLFLGTQADNMKDMHAKGRGATLTWHLVRQIREEYLNGETNRKVLSKKYGVTANMIYKIVKNHSWVEKID